MNANQSHKTLEQIQVLKDSSKSYHRYIYLKVTNI